MGLIDRLLNSITMYRLVLYYLILLLLVAFFLSFFGLFFFGPFPLLLSVAFLLVVCMAANWLFAKVFSAPTNLESVYITALILALIITPMAADIGLLFWAAVLSMASKYIFAIAKKHIFNPATIAVFLTSIGFGGTASWWIGIPWMLPFSLLGFFIAKKIRRLNLLFYFFLTVTLEIFLLSILRGLDPLQTLKNALISTPLFFFAFIMLVEPLTSPTTEKFQTIYAIIVGILFTPLFHIDGFYTTPEMALVIGNIFSFILNPKEKLMLKLNQKVQVARDVFSFNFIPPVRPTHQAGQYMEWTLPHKPIDSRGNRRYFTLASSPTESIITIGVKFNPDGSSFKKALSQLTPTQTIVASQTGGDFVLPKNKNQKLAFIAGGIGVTPFRSIIKYLIDKNERRDIVLFYTAKEASDIAYKDIFDEAEKKLGIKTIYVLTEKMGHITPQMVISEVPDYKDRLFYLSGPQAMVDSYKKMLKKLEVKTKTDYFPGY